MTQNSALVPLSCLGYKSVSDQSGERILLNGRMAHRVLRHIDITSISFLVLSYLLSLARAKTNTGSIYCRLAVNRTAVRIISNQKHRQLYTHMGSTLPSPSTPKPVPSFHPIILKSLFPTLLSSCPGFTGGGGGEGGRVGPSAARRCLRLSSTPSGSGTSGWLCIIRRSDARSRYFGAEAWALLTSAVALAFPLATSRKFASLKLRCAESVSVTYKE